KDNLEQKLKAESEKAITSRNLAELLPEFKEREKLINTLKEKIFTLKKNLSDRQKLKSQLKELDEKYKAQEKISSNWNALNSLIGSAKGDKFRVFAQNITLGMMIDLANSQLEKMNGRYVLMARPESSGLELSVIDKEQAGEIRPTENLSGGERFIISLALALGLSKISGNKSRIDSLFLDEGFGSLDEDALNTALDALGELRRDGRMIGIISHVQALQERIAVQIHVIPKHEGVSIIEGAGVSLIQK
ncbi:MAG: SbcC/MukB-like Walker B domain-containing protein, partial [Synergistales bacterium]|nr:SbcC/MukB-like Walker B domain-containing protein [Synergistales bacterium]